MKKAYVTPEVIVHGTVEDITQANIFGPSHGGGRGDGRGRGRGPGDRGHTGS